MTRIILLTLSLTLLTACSSQTYWVKLTPQIAKELRK